MSKTPETKPEIKAWLYDAIQEVTTDGKGNMVVDINTWNILTMWAFTALNEPAVKKEQPNTINMDRLGRAIHNLRWCKGAEIMHDLAHNSEWPDTDSRTALKRAYEKADEEEKILYGGNA